jgi:hypothetical protein
MQRSISIGLLALLFFQAALLLPLTRLSLEAHRERTQEQLDEELEKEELLELSFSPNELRTQLEWKEAKEFRYRGSMYDVVAAEREEDRILLTVYKDEEESRMLEQHRALREGSTQSSEQDKEGSSGGPQPFKYLKDPGPTPFILHRYRVLENFIPESKPEEAFLSVPLPPPC